MERSKSRALVDLLATKQDFSVKTGGLRTLLENPGSRGDLPLEQSLSQRLVLPLRDSLDKRNLIIVPHGALTRFYKELEKTDERDALRIAQLDTKKKYPHPYYWASFQLTGSAK